VLFFVFAARKRTGGKMSGFFPNSYDLAGKKMPGSALSGGPVQEEQKSRPVLESGGFIPYETLLKIFPEKHVPAEYARLLALKHKQFNREP